jgi:hypothetical protein
VLSYLITDALFDAHAGEMAGAARGALIHRVRPCGWDPGGFRRRLAVLVLLDDRGAGGGDRRCQHPHGRFAWWVDAPAWLLGCCSWASTAVTSSARSRREFEFWLVSIKVAAILVFIALGRLPAALPQRGPTSPTAHGGFAPKGWMAVRPSGDGGFAHRGGDHHHRRRRVAGAGTRWPA